MDYNEIEKSTVEAIRDLPYNIPSEGMIAGFTNAEIKDLVFRNGDNLHYPMGDSYYRYGISGIADAAFFRAEGLLGEEREFMLSLARVYREISDYLIKYSSAVKEVAENEESDRLRTVADTLYAIGKRAPESFLEAVQLMYIMWRLRSFTGTSCIGRLDMHLYDFYKRDIDSGKITDDGVLELICQLWERLNECGSGDTLINVMVGGSDGLGNDTSNPLSVLMLEASLKVRKTEPHINVRFHKNMSEALKGKAIELQSLGHGQGTVYNDDVIIPALVRRGIPLEYASRYTNDGCTEIVIDGCSMIKFEHIDVVATLELALNGGELFEKTENAPVPYCHKDHQPAFRTAHIQTGYKTKLPGECATFEELYEVFLEQYRLQTV